MPSIIDEDKGQNFSKIITDENGHLMGALGVAILSKKQPEINFSFDIVEKDFETTSINCSGCPNNCEVICVKKENKLLDSWGNRCEKGNHLLKENSPT